MSRPDVSAPATPQPHGRPNATPVRVAVGSGFLAVLSAVASAIVAPPAPTAGQAAIDPIAADATPGSASRPIVYVQLKPGETAPPGATVIDAAAPTPMTIVTTITAPPRKATVIKTTQSGKTVP